MVDLLNRAAVLKIIANWVTRIVDIFILACDGSVRRQAMLIGHGSLVVANYDKMLIFTRFAIFIHLRFTLVLSNKRNLRCYQHYLWSFIFNIIYLLILIDYEIIRKSINITNGY